MAKGIRSRRSTTKARTAKTASKPSKGKTRSASKKRATLQQELEKAAKGLVHVSESDRPFHFFSLPAGEQSGLNAEGFLSTIGMSQPSIDEFNLPVDRLIEERALDGFFPSLDDLVAYYGTNSKDPQVVSESRKFRRLESVLKKHLRQLKLFRIGVVEVRCYVAGLDGKGNIAGLVTTAIET